MKSYVKPFVEEIIHSKEFKNRGLFDVKNVHRTFERFCRGEGSNSWQWINTEIWFRTFIDNKNN